MVIAANNLPNGRVALCVVVRGNSNQDKERIFLTETKTPIKKKAKDSNPSTLQP